MKLLIVDADMERRTRLHNEVKALKELRHSCIAVYVDDNLEHYKNSEVELYVITERLPGPSLEQAVGSSLFDRDAAVRVSLSLLNTLEFCHMANILHRDIKPDNIVYGAHEFQFL